MRALVVLVMVGRASAAMAAPQKIKAYASATAPQPFHADVLVKKIDRSTMDDRLHYDIVLSEDPLAVQRPKEFTLAVDLPKGLAMPLAANDHVKVVVGLRGGGPNARNSLLVTGNKGVPIIVIDELPPDWSTAKGKKVSSMKL